jgi:hypothetical protein
MLPYGTRLRYAFRSFFSLLDYGRIPEDVVEAVIGKTPAPTAPAISPPETSDRAVQILALLQRDGRLVDFLMEDLSGYPDGQVGAAVRDVHAGCRGVLTRYSTLAPIIDDEEGRPVTVERGTDPATVKVVGHAAGEPPYLGVLRHRGWQAVRIELPPLPATGRTVITPAEIEIT